MMRRAGREAAEVVAKAAQSRENSRGAHCREDFPETGAMEESYYTVARQEGDAVTVRREDVRFTIVRPGQTVLPAGEPETLVASA